MKLLPKFLFRALLALTVACFGCGAFAGGYPDHPVRIIVPFPPAGPTDIIGRLVVLRLSELLGQQFVVENRGGANGVIGTSVVAKAAPDGYTLLLTASGPVASGLALYHGIPYDVVRDLTPIAIVARSDIVLVARPDFPAKSFKEFLDTAKSKPDGVSAELNTIGSMHHLLTELLRVRTGAKLLTVPYKGSGPAIVDLLGSHVDVGFESVPGVLSYIRSHQLNAYAVASNKRLSSMPDVPTLKELGLIEFVAEPWWAVMAPAGTPKDVIDKLSTALAKVAEPQAVKDQFTAQGMTADWTTPADAAQFVKSEVSRWADIVKVTGAKMD